MRRIALAAACPDLVSDVVHRRIEIGTSRILAQIRAEYFVEKHIAGIRVRLTRIHNAVLQQNFAGQPELAGCGGRLSYMIRLYGTDRNDGVGSFFKRGSH